MRQVPFFLMTSTGLASHSGWKTSTIKPAVKSLATSSPIALHLSSLNWRRNYHTLHFVTCLFALIKHENLDQQKLLHYLAFIWSWISLCGFSSALNSQLLHLLYFTSLYQTSAQ